MRFPNSTRAPVHIPPIIFRNFHKISTPHLLHYPGECGRDGLVVAGAALPVLHSHHPPRRPGRRVQEYVVNVGVEPGSYRVMWPRVLLRCHLQVAALPGLSTLAQLSTKPSAFILSATAVLGGSQLLCRRTRAISSQPASV